MAQNAHQMHVIDWNQKEERINMKFLGWLSIVGGIIMSFFVVSGIIRGENRGILEIILPLFFLILGFLALNQAHKISRKK